MTRPATRRLLSGIVTMLGIAVVAFVLRGVLDDPADTSPPVRAVPGTTAGAATTPQRFSLEDATASGSPKGASAIATARAAAVRVFPSPANGRGRRLARRVFAGQKIPLTFLVVGRRPGWVHVQLPTRPNQSRGWIRSKQVALSYTRLEIEVDVKAHRLRVRNGDHTVLRAPIAVGKALSPTPPGRYFVTDLIKPQDPDGFYGPYALGLSAHSTVYTSFEGGDGQVGIHGTSQPEALGTDVSHGCIRVANRVISRLARLVPLGTPVVIGS